MLRIAIFVTLVFGALTLKACAPGDTDSRRAADVVVGTADTLSPDADPHADHDMAPEAQADHELQQPTTGTEAHAGHVRESRTAAADERAAHTPSSRAAAEGEHADHAPRIAAADPVDEGHAEHAPTTVATDPHAAHPTPAAPPEPHAPAAHLEPGAVQDTIHQHPATPADTAAHADHTGQPEMEHDMPADMAGALGIPMQREASGTAWLPDVSPMYALHSMRGRWMLMLHGVIYVQYINEGSDRGDEQFGSTNWLMGMAKTSALGGHATLRTMLSAEAATVGRCGYPDLLATGETCHGEPLHDRQHPHDLFMELAASYESELSPRLGVQLYGGLAGEPALGPVAYPHRISAISNPMAPISHHWHDATHISFGLVTAGLFGRTWKAEASLFNGREPDEERYNIDLDRLDSYAARLWWLPSPRWALQVSSGHLNEAEPAADGPGREDVSRTTASATHHFPFARSSLIATTLLWGRNSEHGERSDALLLETNLDLGGRHVFFARAERAEKSEHDLQIPHAPFTSPDPCLPPCAAPSTEPERVFTVGQVTGGYLHQLRPIGDLIFSAGMRLSLSLLPRELEPAYGTRAPAGLTLFMSLRARAHRMDTHAAMAH